MRQYRAMISVASYNIRKAVGLDWRRRPGRILGVIAELDADIVVLQEADRRFGAVRRSALSPELVHEAGYSTAPVAIRPASMGWHGNAILYRANRLELLRAGRIELPVREPRGAVLAELKTRAGPIRIVGTHLALTSPMRALQIKAIGDHLAALPALPTVIMGDFNAWRTLPLPDGFIMVAPGPTFHAARPMAALDRFLATPDAGLREAKVHRSALARHASDHLPIRSALVPGNGS